MASRSAPLALQKKRSILVQKGRVTNPTTLRRSSRITPTAQNSSQQQRRRSLRLQGVVQTKYNPVQQTKAQKRPREEQFDPTLPKRQKRTRNTAEQILSPPQNYQKRQRIVESRKRHRKEPTEQPRKRRRRIPPSRETAIPKSTDPSYTSDIGQWALSVASDTAETQDLKEAQLDYLYNMQRFLPEKRLQRKRSSSSIASNSQSDQGYHDVRYATTLEANGSYMAEYRGELPEDAKNFNIELRRTLEKEQPVPEGTLFSDDYFEDTMDMIQDRNEAFIIETIGQLMFPHVPAMVIRGEKRFTPFCQSFNEGWNNCKKITQTRPQPDSSIGLKATAFSAKQLQKLQPYLGDLNAKSDFRATHLMYFPFLTYEVKRGTIGLDIADRQNAHSNTIAVRGHVALLRIMGREQEVHGKILAISISLDHRGARVHGYIPIIKGQNTEVWREEIDAFDFRTRKGKYKWKCLQYSLNALDFGLQLLERIRSAIDDWTPDPELGALRRSETPSLAPSGFSQIFDDQDLSDGNDSIPGQAENTKLQQITPESSTNLRSPQRKKKR